MWQYSVVTYPRGGYLDSTLGASLVVVHLYHSILDPSEERLFKLDGRTMCLVTCCVTQNF